MRFNTKILSRRSVVQYDRTCLEIRDQIGSFESIARQISALASEEVSGETIRRWITERSIPAEYCFVLYELMERAFDIFTLLPWMERYFKE